MYKTSHKFCINYPKWAPNTWFSIILFKFSRILPRVSGKLIWEMTPCVAGYEGIACSSFKYSNENPEWPLRYKSGYCHPFPLFKQVKQLWKYWSKKTLFNSDKNPNILKLSIGNISILACENYSIKLQSIIQKHHVKHKTKNLKWLRMIKLNEYFLLFNEKL